MYRAPLCSDGFSHFYDDENEQRLHNKTLKEAYAHLFLVTMPSFATVFDKLVGHVIKVHFFDYKSKLRKKKLFLLDITSPI